MLIVMTMMVMLSRGLQALCSMGPARRVHAVFLPMGGCWPKGGPGGECRSQPHQCGSLVVYPVCADDDADDGGDDVDETDDDDGDGGW